jgi:hypothetical protein
MIFFKKIRKKTIHLLVHCFFFQFEKLENLVELLEEQPKGTGRYHCMCVCLIFFVSFFLYLEPGRATHMFTHPERERERERESLFLLILN